MTLLSPKKKKSPRRDFFAAERPEHKGPKGHLAQVNPPAGTDCAMGCGASCSASTSGQHPDEAPQEGATTQDLVHADLEQLVCRALRQDPSHDAVRKILRGLRGKGFSSLDDFLHDGDRTAELSEDTIATWRLLPVEAWLPRGGDLPL